MENGYHKRILLVNLSRGVVRVRRLDDETLRAYIGGASLAAALTWSLMGGRIDPLSPANVLTFMTGPLTGTLAPSSGRHAVTAISPLTGGWGESTSGGLFGCKLRRAGFDGIVVLGASGRPVYLYVRDGEAEIRDAQHLWGLGTYDTQDEIRRETDPAVSVACIGPAGERLVKYAAVINDSGRAAGRTGMGAVMGAKKLKAVAVVGSAEIEPERSEFSEYALSLHRELRESAFVKVLRTYGTAIYVESGVDLGDVPAKYFTRSSFPAREISGATLAERFSVKSVACFGCPIGCGRQVSTPWGIVDGPEYETIAAFGPLNWIFDLEAIVRANHLCNDMGMDTISAGVTIAFAAYLKERGLLPREYEREAPEWGDGERLVEVVEKIGFREGIGDLLAEGTREVAKRLGVDSGLAANVKGLEIPMHDPRAFFGMALSYATGVRGACHLRGDFYSVDLGYFQDPDLGLSQGDRFQVAGRAREVIALQNLREVFNSALLCVFTNFTSGALARLLALATGWDTDPATVHEIGGRSFDLKRKINSLQGLGPEEDRLPEIVLEPLTEGGAAGRSPANQLKEAIEEYYKLRAWKT